MITDTLPVQSQCKAVTKGIQIALRQAVPSGLRYRILHHAARSHYGLQIADYCSWAMFRKWEGSDPAPYARIQPAIRREFEIFAKGTRFHYSHGASPQTQ